MNREFIEALQQLALERGVSTEEVLEAFKEALRKAYIKRQKGYKKEEVEEGKGPEVDVYIDPQTGG
jgi:N utilization substance protein A